jgi:DNA-binding CsgD family transcriptional regulator
MGVAHGLLYAGMSELFSGSLDAARGHFDERSQLMKAVGLPLDVGDVISLAWSGRDAETRAEARLVAAYATERSYGWMLFFVEYAMCVLELGLGNYRAAFDTAIKNYDESPFLCLTSFPDFIEAAVRCGERAAGERALDELHARALPNQTPLALGLLARSRALLGDDDSADDLYREALEQLARSRAQVQFARTQLLYGEWLRRRKRRLDAREQLRSAHQLFVAAGAGAFAERARRELVATGEHTRARSSSVDELTPQERAIAELAATGATNAEIAIKLFLSPATVDYHLRKVYRKLAISSRRNLAAALTRSAESDE